MRTFTPAVKKFGDIFLFCLLVFFAVIFAFFPKYDQAVISGIKLWAACIVPCLFPYIFITAILYSVKTFRKIAEKISHISLKIFNIGGQFGYAFLVSALSGYPAGAKTVAELKNVNALSETESVRAAAICSSASPYFTISVVGGITFSSFKFGTMVFVCNFLSVIAVGLIFSFYKRKDKGGKPQEVVFKSYVTLNEGANSAVINILTVGGIITLFFVLAEMLKDLGIMGWSAGIFGFFINDKNLAEGLSYGLIDYTLGIKAAANGGIAHLSLPCVAAMCGFGGLSSITQSLGFLKKSKIKTAPFWAAKILSGLLNFTFGSILSAAFLI